MDTRTIRARDDGLRRLRRLTLGATATAGALAVAFAGLAEKAFPGRSSHARTTTRLVHAAKPRVAADPAQTAPPLVSVGSQQQAPAQAQPQQAAPTPTAAPPVVVSGGS